MKDLTEGTQEAGVSDFEDESGKDAARTVVAMSLSLLFILASSITILYIWKSC